MDSCNRFGGDECETITGIPGAVEGYALKAPVGVYDGGHGSIDICTEARRAGQQWGSAHVTVRHPAYLDAGESEHWILTKNIDGTKNGRTFQLTAGVRPDGSLAKFHGPGIIRYSDAEAAAIQQHAIVLGEPLIRAYERLLGMEAHRAYVRALPLPDPDGILLHYLPRMDFARMARETKVYDRTVSRRNDFGLTVEVNAKVHVPCCRAFEVFYRRKQESRGDAPVDAFSAGTYDIWNNIDGRGIARVGPAAFEKHADGRITSRYAPDVASVAVKKVETLQKLYAAVLDIDGAWETRLPKDWSADERQRREFETYEAALSAPRPLEERLAELRQAISHF